MSAVDDVPKKKKLSGAAKKQKRKLAEAQSVAEGLPVKQKQEAGASGKKSNNNKKKKLSASEKAANAANEAKTVIVGGLPYDSTHEKLSKDFGKCGKIQKLNLPKDKSTGQIRGFAFVTFATQEGIDAALKFNGKEYCGRRLTARMAGEKPDGSKPEGNKPTKAPVVAPENELCVFVGGLPHNVTDKSLRRYFFEAGDIQNLKLPLNEEGLPKGFAFITFKDKAEVAKALNLDGGMYAGREVVVRLSGSGGGKGAGKGQGKDKGSGYRHEFTVFVQGLTYSTTEKTLRKAFSKCGEIVNLKLPMCQWDETQSRGFAFISYKDEASVNEALKLDGNESMSYAGSEGSCYMSVRKAVAHEEAAKMRDNRQSEPAGVVKEKVQSNKHVDKREPKIAPPKRAEPPAQQQAGPNQKIETNKETGALVESTGKKMVFDSDDSDDDE